MKMKKKRQRQEGRAANSPRTNGTTGAITKGLPSIEETEAYIREHGLKVINPLSDFGFKRLLATERNKDILIHLLNTFISEDSGTITDVTYLPTELLGVSKEDKFVRFDLYCKNQNGDRFIVEMQNGWQKHFGDRAIVYMGRAAGQSVKRGDNLYEDVKGVYSLNIVTYNMPEFKGNGNFFWRVYLKDDRNKIFSKKNVLYFVELSKFAAQLETLDMADERNHWLYMLTQAVHLNQNDVEAMTPVFQRFYEECQIAKFTDMDKRNYVRNVLEFEDVKEMMECEREFAEQAGYERGVQEGMLQGIEKGMEKGREEGMEKGREEGREEALLQTAKNLLALGIPLDNVAKATGLSEEQIRQLL